MDKGSQNPVDSQAVCRQQTAVLLWPIQLFHSVGWERLSTDASLAEGKSHFCLVAWAVKHMQPFKTSNRLFVLQRSDCSHYLSMFSLCVQGKLIKLNPPFCYFIEFLL